MLIAEKMKEQRRFGLPYFRSCGAKLEASCILAPIIWMAAYVTASRFAIYGWTANL
jgi:hypothetical protein